MILDPRTAIVLPESLTSDALNDASKPVDKLMRAKKKRMKKD
jgi:hypothetical protein